MSSLRLVRAVVGTVLLTWGLAVSSGAALRWHATNAALLRLSWSARPERIETCRRLSDAELESRPVHMRQRVSCEGRTATYELRVAVDGVVLDSAVIAGGGLRNDRPVFLLREYPVPAGARDVRVTFIRREAGDSLRATDAASDGSGERAREGELAREGEREERELEQRRERVSSAIPPRLEYDGRSVFRPGSAVLVTVERGALVLRSP